MLKATKKFSLFQYFLIFMVLVLATTGLSCSKSNNTQTTPQETTTASSTTTQTTNLATVDPTTVNSTFSKNFNSAKQKATAWKSDAVLYSFTEKLPVDLSLNNGTETYVFGSAGDQANWWVYSLSEATSKSLRALIPKEDYLGNTLSPISDKYWKSNYLQAFQKADLYQGSAFRAANPNTEVTVILATGEPKGWLWWTVEYKSTSGNSLKIKINPLDLTIVDESGNIVTTSTAGQSTTSNTASGTATGTTSTTTGTSTSTTTPNP